MRRLAAAVLAVPVIASIYLGLMASLPGARRYLAGTLAIVVVGAVGITLAAPTPATSIPPSQPVALSADRLHPVETSLGDTGGTAPDAGTDTAAVVSDGGSDGSGSSSAAADGATSSPEFTPGSLPAGTIISKAPVRDATKLAVTGSRITGNRVRLDTAFVFRFDRPVTLAAVKASLSISPAVKGTLKSSTGSSVSNAFIFTPAAKLAVNTRYTISFKKAIKDGDGIAVATPKAARLLTAAAPSLVRFRPLKGTTEVDPTQVVSVRFTRAMNKATTAKAFSVVVAGKRVVGKIIWVEADTVLIFTPTKPFAKGAGVGVRLAATATSADGVPIKKGSSSTFSVVAPPTVAAKSRSATPKPKPVVKPRSGGGSVGAGAWGAAERYYLTLMNCTRTGGLVTSSGACSSPGGRDVAPLWIDQGISDKVSRPYAKFLATNDICSHFADGNPGHRLARAGYSSYQWAENISCPKGMDVTDLMIYTQIYFQNERSYNGGHYVNLMNPDYDRVGIGVWVANGRAEVVINFYHP